MISSRRSPARLPARLAAAAAALVLGGPAACDDEDDAVTGVGRTATVSLVNTAGAPVGLATLTEREKGVEVALTVSGMPAGEHAVHFHEVGVCTPPFTTALEHYNPTSRQHGFENPNGPHAADLPNILVGVNGAGTLTTLTPYVTLNDGASNTLADANGTALIVHTNADDYATDPSGNAGGRIACGVVTRN